MKKRLSSVLALAAAAALMGAGCSATTKVDTNTENNTRTSMETSATSVATNTDPAKTDTETKPETTTTPPDSNPAKPETKVNAAVSTTVDVKVPTTAASVKVFTVTGSNFSFDKSTLTVKKGDLVKITFINAEGFHDLKIDEFNVATKKLSGGGQETVEFTATKTGSFEYYCSVGNHRAMGMKGTLIVQ